MYFSQFIKYKTYIGNNKKNTFFISSWLLFRLRGYTWIINLYKTISVLKYIFSFLKHLVINNLPIWFVNLERSREFIILNWANYCGEILSQKLE